MIAAGLLLLGEPGRAALAEPGVPVPPGELLKGNNAGELTDADRDLVVKVRLAGLWEIPAGEMAQEKSDDPRIQEIGKTISGQHVKLDELARAAAKKLKVKLPDKPNQDQQGWLGEMRDAKNGEEFDQIYIDRLRAAHGKIFPAIATVRTSTRNDAVRKLAQQANQFVMTHLTLLESSGLVDYTALPAAPAPSAAAPAAAKSAELTPVARLQQAKVSMPVAVGVLGGVLLISFLLIRRSRTSRRRGYRSRNAYR